MQMETKYLRLRTPVGSGSVRGLASVLVGRMGEIPAVLYLVMLVRVPLLCKE
jgi:hypothetical protein